MGGNGSCSKRVSQQAEASEETKPLTGKTVPEQVETPEEKKTCNSKPLYGLAYICCSGCCFVALVPLLGQGFFCYLTEVSPNKNKAEQWAERPWVRQECQVLGKGIAYRGSCKDTWLGDAPSGSECTTSDSTWTAEEMNAASVCEAKAKSEWADARRLLGTDAVDTSNVGAAPQVGRRLGCGHSFLPWVQVSLNGTKRCAYKFCMAVSLDASISTTTADDSEDFLKKFYVGTSTSCYTHSSDDCAVALEFPMDYLTDTWAWMVAGWPINLVIQAGFGCLALGFLCCLVICCCMPKDLFDDKNDSETPMLEGVH